MDLRSPTEMTVSSTSPRVLPLDPLRLTAALCMLGAGLMHLMIVPDHAEHAPAHAWFFAVSGILQIAWGAVGWRRTRPALDLVGMVLAGSLILLWFVTRIYPAPFSTHPEEVDGAGVISKVLEAGVVVALAVAVAREGGRRWAAAGVFLSMVAAAGLYAGGRLAEPWLPSLWGQDEDAAGAAEPGVHSHLVGQRIRLDDQPMGPWVVRVLTSPYPPRPGDFLVEVRVKDAGTGEVRQDLEVWIEARRDGEPEASVRVPAAQNPFSLATVCRGCAKIPGEYAAQVPVPEAGIWLVTVSVDGPEGRGQVGFSERVSSSLGLGAWMSALLPFAGLALLVLGYAALVRAFPEKS